MASLPRAGRNAAASASRLLGNRDPRHGRNARATLTTGDEDETTIQRNNAGRSRVAALDGIAPLVLDGLTLEDVGKRLNLVVRLLQGK